MIDALVACVISATNWMYHTMTDAIVRHFTITHTNPALHMISIITLNIAVVEGVTIMPLLPA
jgi:hypothetical protein